MLLAANNDSIKDARDETDVFRWINFGSCTLRIAFDTPEFYKNPYFGMPVQISKIWRREVSSVMSDWDTAIGFSAPLPPSLFSDAWLSTIDAFRSADVVLVDLVLDIFQDRHLRFRRPNEAAGDSYNSVVSNFPSEPPADLEAEIHVYDCDPASSLHAWEEFGRSISTPTVFITYENRDDVRPGYDETFRKKLLDYQAGIAELAKGFPHWLIISQDDVFAEIGLECYVDRHHPSPLGWKILREVVPKLIAESGIIRPRPGGAPRPASTEIIPERCDFDVLDTEHLRRLRTLEGPACAVGPPRLTAAAQAAFSPQELAGHSSFTPLQNGPKPGLIVVLKWNQPANMPKWLSGLLQQYPESLVEIPCLWRGREQCLLSDAEKAFRRELKAFAKANEKAVIELPATSAFRHRYAARLMLGTHVTSAVPGRLAPLSDTVSSDPVRALPTTLSETLTTLDIVPVFGKFS